MGGDGLTVVADTTSIINAPTVEGWGQG